MWSPTARSPTASRCHPKPSPPCELTPGPETFISRARETTCYCNPLVAAPLRLRLDLNEAMGHGQVPAQPPHAAALLAAQALLHEHPSFPHLDDDRLLQADRVPQSDHHLLAARLPEQRPPLASLNQ